MQRIPFGRQPPRHYDIITNLECPSASYSLPKIPTKNASLLEKNMNTSSHFNRSNYNYDIITSRGLTNSLAAKESQKITNRKVYLASKFSQDASLSSMRFRDNYGDYSSNKRFNRKKGIVNEFLGSEVNTITGWLKKH